MSKEFTLSDVSEHASKNDLFVVVHDKVYNTTSFVDEHPGGEEVMLDVGGQDATEAFEDVGHSDEAREILNGMLVGTLKRKEGEEPSKTSQQYPPKPGHGARSDGAGMGVGLYAVVLVGVVLAFVAYTYLQSNSESK